MANGPLGKERSVVAVIGLSIITLGIYGIVWVFKSYDEMKAHRGDGISGTVGVLLAVFVMNIPNVFLLPSEAGKLYASEGKEPPVSGKTGFWVLLPFVGGIIWFIKVQGALNDHWASHTADAVPTAPVGTAAPVA